MVLTTGIKEGPVIARQELRKFLTDKDVTNLYILAIDHMQKTDQKDLGSWFQLAAIHGRPFIPYDNVGEKGSFGGYCTHSSILFPTWHRPFLALFEQNISKHVFEIANAYPDPADKRRYIAAAHRFRIPYWDWATQPELPDIIAKQEAVDVHTPKGTHSIRNPLFSYHFHPVYSDFGDGLPDEKTWESWQSTVRYPTSTNADGKSQPDSMQKTLKNNTSTLRNRTYNLLTQANDYLSFSNDGFNGDKQNPLYYDSIESIHGLIHGLAGNNGHMGVVDYAAFDPVFWMHHGNVDRIFALWQVLHPDIWVVPKVTEKGTFTTKPGSTQDAETPLTPFRRTSDKFWVSNDVHETSTFNYTYPEIEALGDLSGEERRNRLRLEINKLYGRHAPVSAAVPSVFKGLPAAGSAAGSAKPSAVDTDSPFLITAERPDPSSGWHQTASTADDLPHYHEWIANIVVEKYAVKSTFFVHVFLGDFTNDPKGWGSDPNLVGSHAVFANNLDYTGCENCRDAFETRKLVTGTVPLTESLAGRFGQRAILEPKDIVPYLQKNLHWRVQKNDGTAIPHANIPSLKFTIGTATVTVPKSASEFGVWGECAMQAGVGSHGV